MPVHDDRFEELFERSPIGAVVVSADGVVELANAAACRLLGVAAHHVVGASAGDLVPAENLEDVEATTSRLIEGSADEAHRERRIVRPDGSAAWVDVTTQAVRADDGTFLYVLATMVDTTELRRAHEARTWLEEAAAASQDAIIGTRLDGEIMNWNAGAERIFGYTAEEMVGRNATILRPPGAEPEIQRLQARIVRGERSEQRVVRIRKDGSLVTVLSSSAPVRDGDGIVIGTATVARDIGEQERADALFRSLLEAAPDAMVCFDDNGAIALVNSQAERLFGYARDELLGTSVERLVPLEAGESTAWYQSADLIAAVPLSVDGGRARPAQRRDGSTFPAEISLSAIQTNDGPLRSMTVRDGTERRQAAIVASSTDAIIGRDTEGVITSWNGGAERLYGYTAAEAIGTTMPELIPDGLRAEMRQRWNRVQRSEVVEHYETKRLCRDGTTIDVAVTMSPIRDPDGAVVGSSTVARDITEATRSLEALRALEARKSAMFESALDCIITMDAMGRVLEFNPAAERTFGYGRDEVVGQDLGSLIIPEASRASYVEGLARYRATGRGLILGQRLEMDACRADGTVFPIELSVTRVDLPGPALFTGYIRDLTNVKQAETELETSAGLLRAMLDNSPTLVSLTAVDGRCLFMNERLATTFGFDRDSVVGQTTHELWPAAAADLYREMDREVLQSGTTLEYETTAIVDGAERTFNTVKFAVRDASGQPYAAAAIATDITESKVAQAEREALAHRHQQSERLESLGQLAGGVAHDFNNLLGAILNYSEFVAEQVADRPEVLADVEEIKSAAERGARLTRQLLTVGRRQAIAPEDLDLDDIVAEMRNLLSRTLGEHVVLVVRSTPALPPITADRGQMEQVLLNLAVNARDAMPEGGTLTIATSVVDLDDAYVRVHPDSRRGPHVELLVADTGTGMPPEVVARVFEPFFTTKPVGEGTGLGLATVYSVMSASAGNLDIESVVGQGTTFRLVFPAVVGAVESANGVGEPMIGGNGEVVLVVDDERALLTSTARILRHHGYRVFEATTGDDALRLAAEHTVHLVLTDTVMPHMSGSQLAARLAAQRPNTPVLFMSGYNVARPAVGVEGPTSATHLSKPFTVDELLHAVHEALS